VTNKGLFNLDLEEKETKGLSNLGIGVVTTKGLFNLDLSCGDQRAFQPRSDEREPRDFLTSELELLKCRSKSFSTSIKTAACKK